ncbi:sulfite exporter TauE/SafE family protein [Corynebacterium aquatimens]|uniref:Probable membrane transporter protein n=1 Tax=Corynebacterium aquatimens TaxID=1190508 RepID=A0A931E265_9CORY|nr:sulfite exporter TauE/SafE family protein [Corynebacterium aquatimens]MBG6122888.1 putative membrane protein YfcA [Corynebacterium aquatimens]
MSTLVFIGVAGFLAQLVDGGLGMGYGLTATTVLITLAGLTPAAASAVVNASQLGTNLVSGASHWKFGNVDWKLVAGIGIPGAVGAFVGATLLSNISTSAAKPIMAIILVGLGAHLVWRFSFGMVHGHAVHSDATLNHKPHNKFFLAGIGLLGGFFSSTGGGGWGPVTTTSLMAAGRNEPRRIVGTVNTAEFFVSCAATLGFILGMWSDLVANAAAVLALVIGGCIAAPIAAWLIGRLNPVLLGGFVGSLIVALNIPTLFKLFDGPQPWLFAALAMVTGITLTVMGARKARRNSLAASEAEGATTPNADRAAVSS